MYYVENFFREKSIIIIYFNFILFYFAYPKVQFIQEMQNTHIFLFFTFQMTEFVCLSLLERPVISLKSQLKPCCWPL